MVDREKSLGCDLGGAGVLVTRATHQAEPLCTLITSMGGRPVRFPAVAIKGPRPHTDDQASLVGSESWDLMIFISPNAVEWGLKQFSHGLPQQASIAAVGGRTASLLREAGYAVDIVPPDRSDSEALLAMPPLQEMAGKRVAIFRGDGGRPLLGDTLVLRGADVSYLEVYRRCLPEADASGLLTDWARQIDLVTVTSSDLLDNLFSLVGQAGQALLRTTPMIVISERMVTHATSLGCQKIQLAEGADLQSLQRAICRWRQGT